MRLGAINKYTGENVSRSLTEHSGVKGLIIDLRGNPGGMLQEAVRVAGLFIDGGIVASSKGRSPDSTEYYNAPAGDVLDNKPIVVLIDGQTASSAEVLAAALQEQSRAVVVGTGSYGKGTVQKLIKLSNNSRLALTNGIIYTPSGNKLAGIGVLPDICTSGEPETRDAEKLLPTAVEAMPACRKPDEVGTRPVGCRSLSAQTYQIGKQAAVIKKPEFYSGFNKTGYFHHEIKQTPDKQ